MDDIDEDISLPSRYRRIPLEALNVSVRRRLSLFLNIERLPNEHGIMGDFSGLAEQIGFSYLEIQNFCRVNVRDPTSEVLNEWTRRPDLLPTVENLFTFLQRMERVDILTDLKKQIIKDIEVYIGMQERKQDSMTPLQDDTITQSEESDDGTDHDVDEHLIATIHDVEHLTPCFYDAFVCYDPEGYDLQFVKKMLSELEAPRYNLKLCVPWRDDLPGASRHTVTARLIQDRCRRMVIIMSPRFLKSPACDFQTKFAHSLSPGSRSKKLVPVLITPCHIPQILRHVTLCDFTKRDLMEWFWVRLARAIQAPLKLEELQVDDRINLEDIKLNVKGKSAYYANSGSSSSSSQPLPINHSQNMACGSGSSNNSPVLGQSPMDQSGSPPNLDMSYASLQSVTPLAGLPSPSPPQAPLRSRKIPKLFPTSQC